MSNVKRFEVEYGVENNNTIKSIGYALVSGTTTQIGLIALPNRKMVCR